MIHFPSEEWGNRTHELIWRSDIFGCPSDDFLDTPASFAPFSALIINCNEAMSVRTIFATKATNDFSGLEPSFLQMIWDDFGYRPSRFGSCVFQNCRLWARHFLPYKCHQSDWKRLVSYLGRAKRISSGIRQCLCGGNFIKIFLIFFEADPRDTI